MKKTTKLIIFALSLMIIASCAVGISASAAEEESGALSIKSINLAYKDKVELLVAVDIDNAERDNVEVTYTINGEKKTASLHPTETYTDDGKTYPVFYAAGIAPKDIADVMTFEAHVKDSGAIGEAYSASILDYLYARLYKNGFIDAVPGTDDARKKALYENTLKYAASAQDVLVNLNSETPETLVTDYVFVWSDDENAKVASDRYFGAFKPGTEITPVHSDTITEWSLMDTNDGKLGDAKYGVAVAITEHTKLVAGAVDSPVIHDFETDVSNDYVKVYDGDGNPVEGNYVQGSSLSMGLATLGGSQCLQVRNPADSGKTGKTTVAISNQVQEGNCYTFGAKIRMVGASNGYAFATLNFVNEAGTEAVSLNLTVKNNAASKACFAIATTGSSAHPSKGTALFDFNNEAIETGKWIDVRIEFYFPGAADKANAEEIAEVQQNSFIKVYVNGNPTYSGNSYWTVTSDISHVEILHVTNGKAQNSAYDDIYFTRTDKEYTAN